jgi:anti-sigma factor RsiW
MYREESGQRLTLYARADLNMGKETAFRYAQRDNVSVFYWSDGNVAYALSGEVDRVHLMPIAEAIYAQLNR